MPWGITVGLVVAVGGWVVGWVQGSVFTNPSTHLRENRRRRSLLPSVVQLELPRVVVVRELQPLPKQPEMVSGVCADS